MPIRQCCAPACGRLTKRSYCDKHRPWRNKASNDAIYKTQRWRKARAGYLRHNPICVACEVIGRTNPAEEVDHIQRHNGNAALFWDVENWQPLCKPCHSAKTHSEVFGGGGEILPRWLDKPQAKVVVVCGPPGAGKSRYVALNYPSFQVIDVSRIKAEISGEPQYADAETFIYPAIQERNRRLNNITEPTVYESLAPQRGVRNHWRELLNAEVVVLDTPAHTCLERIEADKARAVQPLSYWQDLVFWWWHHYIEDGRDKSASSVAL